MIMTCLILSAVLTIIVCLFVPTLGKSPSGERLKLIEQSPNYINDKFQNIENTPTFSEGNSVKDIALKHLTVNKKTLKPTSLIPSVKTDLKNISIGSDVMIWFGHSSYFLQLSGKRFLIDPVFSGKASPLPIGYNSFKGTDIYSVDDMPDIDILLITHDHYDHLDYATIKQLKSKVKAVVCGLGVGEHFEFWGYDHDIIIEKDWDQSIQIDKNITLFTETTRHFSGRQFSRNKTLWMSYVLVTSDLKIYIGGDSGYGSHFKKIGNKHGAFDLVVLENGQYNEIWSAIHLSPGEVLKAAKDLNAKKVFPVHSAKFTLAFHPWDEPLIHLSEINTLPAYKLPLLTPIIGELVNLNDHNQQFSKWWEALE